MTATSQALDRLVQTASLQSIAYRELYARRGDGKPSTTSAQPEYMLGIDRNEDQALFRLRLRCTIDYGDGSLLVVEPEAEYRVEDESLMPLSHELIVEFANEVAVMALIPYLREALADLSLRVLGSAILMPVMLRGAIRFTAEPPDTHGEPEE